MKSVNDWGKVIVSTIVVLGFVGITVMYMTQKLGGGSVPEILSILLGSLATNFTAVVGYWIGSSAGSSMKDQALADAVHKP